MKIFWICCKNKFLSSVPYLNLLKSRFNQNIKIVVIPCLDTICAVHDVFNVSKSYTKEAIDTQANYTLKACVALVQGTDSKVLSQLSYISAGLFPDHPRVTWMAATQ